MMRACLHTMSHETRFYALQPCTRGVPRTQFRRTMSRISRPSQNPDEQYYIHCERADQQLQLSKTLLALLPVRGADRSRAGAGDAVYILMSLDFH